MKKIKSYQEIQADKSDEAAKKSLLKDLPMMTRDEKEIHLNDVIYGYYYRSGYNWSEGCQVDIDAYRVISIDNSRRFFRLRCMKGCETEISMKNECDSTGYYSSMAALEKDVRAKMDKDIAEGRKKIEKVVETINLIKSTATGISRRKIHVPKAVKL